MERLTFFENGSWWIRLNGAWYGGFPEVDRLAAYEDTGLDPEEIKVILERYHAFRSAISDETGQPMVSWTRAGEICRAEKDGRLVVLPAHGRWIPFHSEIAGDIQYCSVCEIGFEEKMDFCPHCGAKMNGKQKEDNNATD